MKNTTIHKKEKMDPAVKKTLLAMFLVVFSMALIFNFSIKLAWSHDNSDANIILWPIKQFMELLIYKWIAFDYTSKVAKALVFFLTDTPYVFVIMIMFSYSFNYARAFSTDQQISEWIQKHDGFSGRVIGALLGFASPFCSCSTIPVMTTLAKSRAPFGTVIAFLITSPMVNESGIALMWGYFGYKVALIYIAFGLVVGFLGSYIATWLKMEDSFLVKPDPIIHGPTMALKNSSKRRHKVAVEAMKKMVKQIWWILILALIVGAIMHGWIPEDWIKNNVGDKWWGPLALIPIGILLYLNISATLPITNSFVQAGLGMGSAMGFTMAVNTVSLPEILILSKLFKRKFIIFFTIYLLVMILIFSYMLMAIPDSTLRV